MERNYKITIPEPCTENWDKMTPNESGRFCISCAKTVVDFTEMLPDEVKHFFVQNQNTKICGRFKNSQLETITIQIPSRILYTQTHYNRMFLLALFIAMGTTLFSCQDQNGNKQKIDKVEVVGDTSTAEEIMVGDVKYNPNDSLHNIPPPPPPPKVNAIKFIKEKTKVKSFKFQKPQKISYGETVSDKNKVQNKDDIYITGMVLTPQINPTYPGGITKFIEFFVNEFSIPEGSENLKDQIRISFIIETDGTLSYIKPLKSIGQDFDNEISRVLKLSQKWEPAELNGKKTRMSYILPIRIQNDTTKTSNDN